MEAVWKIEVEDFPAFIVTDDKGNDFFQNSIWGDFSSPDVPRRQAKTVAARQNTSKTYS